MKKVLPLFLMLGFGCNVLGCSGISSDSSRPPVPDSVMVQLFIEMHLTEARGEIFDDNLTATRDSIFRQYGVTPAAFESAMGYYAEHPDAYLEVYSKALDKLSDERFLPMD